MSKRTETPVAPTTDEQIEQLSEAILNIVERIVKLEEEVRVKAKR